VMAILMCGLKTLGMLLLTVFGTVSFLPVFSLDLSGQANPSSFASRYK
jgi:hypothetical protein